MMPFAVVDQDRVREPEPLDRLGDLADLLLRMRARIARVGLEHFGGEALDAIVIDQGHGLNSFEMRGGGGGTQRSSDPSVFFFGLARLLGGFGGRPLRLEVEDGLRLRTLAPGRPDGGRFLPIPGLGARARSRPHSAADRAAGRRAGCIRRRASRRSCRSCRDERGLWRPSCRSSSSASRSCHRTFRTARRACAGSDAALQGLLKHLLQKQGMPGRLCRLPANHRVDQRLLEMVDVGLADSASSCAAGRSGSGSAPSSSGHARRGHYRHCRPWYAYSSSACAPLPEGALLKPTLERVAKTQIVVGDCPPLLSLNAAAVHAGRGGRRPGMCGPPGRRR